MQSYILFAHFTILTLVCCFSKNNTYNFYRLPTSLRPYHYDLRIITHLEDAKHLFFTGDVQIKFRALQSTSYIILHAATLLKIVKNSIHLQYTGKNNTKQTIDIESSERNPKYEYFILQLAKPLREKQSYKLKLQFCSTLGNKLSGYYVSCYNDKAYNATKYLSVTQFEPTDARAAFPCFDEPEFKATFNITLAHEQHYNALSNMPLIEKIPVKGRPNWYWSVFEQTLPMSTYLVAFSINDFEGLASNVNQTNQVEFTTWARASVLEQCHYAAIVGPYILSYYEQMFDITYPLPKMDQLAVPDFSASAMENWGLIVYREVALFYAEEDSGQMDKLRVTNVIAHELAHQWFGNLVTMKWWNELWLNEGFATYMAMLGIQKLCNEWHPYAEESLDNVLAILSIDSLYSTRPISQSVDTAADIGELFDPITYRKGAVIVRMMHMFIGDVAFRVGINAYLKKHVYGNADQRDLWQALTSAAQTFGTMSVQLNMQTIMDTWTLQTGYPLVTVKRNFTTNTAILRQRRFVMHGDEKLPDKLAEPVYNNASNHCWFIPVSYATEGTANFSATGPKAWFQCNVEGKALPLSMSQLPDDSEWILLNVQLTAPYRVNYDEANWSLLIKSLQSIDFKRIHTINRAQLIDDSLALAWSGVLPYKIPIELMKYMKQERAFMPWRAALDQLMPVYRIMRQTSDFDLFQKFMYELLHPIYAHLGGLNYTNNKYLEHHIKQLPHKTLVAEWSCRLEHKACVKAAMAYYHQWYLTEQPDITNPVPQNVRSIVYCTAMRHGDADDWNFLWLRFANVTAASEQRLILLSLGCSQEVWLLQRYLKLIFEPNSIIRKQDASLAFSAVASGAVGSHLARDFFFNYFKTLSKFFEPSLRELAGLLVQICQHLSTSQDYELLKQFETKQGKVLQQRLPRSIRLAKEQVQLNLRWRQRRLSDFLKRLRTHFS